MDSTQDIAGEPPHVQQGPLSPIDFKNPAILLAGPVDYAMYGFFRDRLMAAPETGLVVIEVSTLGGDPEVAREGPLKTCIASLKAKLHEIEHSIVIENEGFENLVRGSSVSMDEVLRRAPENWYIEAQDAKSLGLVEDVI